MENYKTSLRIGVIIAAVILLVDLFFASEASIAIFKFFLISVIFLIMAIFKFRDKVQFKFLLSLSSVFLSGILVSYIFVSINNFRAKSVANEIIKACEDYKTKNGFYPQKIEDLTKDYISNIPKAKFTLLWGDFYLLDKKLIYINTPPLNVVEYDLENGKWGYGGTEAFAKILNSYKKN